MVYSIQLFMQCASEFRNGEKSEQEISRRKQRDRQGDKFRKNKKEREAARLKRSRDETKGEEKIEFEKMRMSSRGGKTAKEKNRKQQKKVM